MVTIGAPRLLRPDGRAAVEGDCEIAATVGFEVGDGANDARGDVGRRMRGRHRRVGRARAICRAGYLDPEDGGWTCAQAARCIGVLEKDAGSDPSS